MGISARREREKQYRRDTILAAARDLFFTKGYRTTMEEIAERSELSKGTLYLYFNSKDELYISVIMEGFHLLEERMNRALMGTKGTEERVKAIYFSFIDHCMENREYFRITQYFLTEEARENTSDDLVDAINGYTGVLLEHGVEVIREGIESGEFREDLNARDIALITWRMATGVLDLAVLEDEVDGGARTFRELFETAIEIMLRGVRRVT